MFVSPCLSLTLCLSHLSSVYNRIITQTHSSICIHLCSSSIGLLNLNLSYNLCTYYYVDYIIIML